MKGLHHQTAKIQGLENLILWRAISTDKLKKEAEIEKNTLTRYLDKGIV